MAAGIHGSVPAALTIAAGLILLYILWTGWPFNQYPGARAWTLLFLATALWDLSYGLALTVFDPTLRWWFELPIQLGRMLSILAILAFALQYTGRGDLVRSPWLYPLYTFYAIAFALAVTNPLHHLMWTNYHITPVYGAAAVQYNLRLYYAVIGVSYLVVFLSIVLLVDTIVRYGSVFRRQLAALVGALAIPSLANLLWALRLPPTRHLDTTALGHIAIASLLTYALFQEDLFEVVPATRHRAERAALDDLATAVFTVAPDGRVITLNSAAADLVAADGDAVLLDPIDEYLSVEIPPTETTTTVSNPFGQQHDYTVAISELVGETPATLGYTISLQDVTTERLRQQRLTVLNRILRHNLRNDLSVITGNAEAAQHVTADTLYHEEISPLMDGIVEAAGQLLEVGEKARRAEQTLFDDPEADAAADLSAVCSSVVRQQRERFPESDISLNVSDSVSVRVDDGVLRLVLENLIENAVVHSDVTTPEVTVTVTAGRDETEAVVRVVDNGPGIPDQELAPFRRGDEDPLHHGSGIGLWIVVWGARMLGAAVSVDTGDDGTCVSLRFSDAVTTTSDASGLDSSPERR